MTSNRRWMYERWDGQYLNSDFASGVDRFLEFAKHEQSYIHSGQLRCPCSKCKNLRFHDVEQIREHLYRRGFVKNYYEWVHHGESYADVVPLSSESNPYRDMVMDVLGPNYENFDGTEGGVQEEPHPEAKKLLQMLKDAQKPLYEGCSRSLLGMASQIINMKSEFNLPHRCVDRFSSILHDCFPNQNVMTSSFSETRRIVEGLELPHEKIHVCPNGCLLFWQENTNSDSCFKCGENRYKMTSSGKLVPTKVLIYFPITPRLQRLYATKYIAKQMRWHAEHHCIDGVMEHPSDGEPWRHVDTMYSDFAQDPRNVRLGLCTDGFAPFAKSASNYSCWPVLITPYNLPPWLCMKNQFLFLTLIIPGPKSPKGNLDVFLQPVIQELRGLWEFGALTYDMSRKQNFMLRALLLWTISDFPAYGMLSGWSTSGKLACAYCMKHTKSFWLKYGRKVSWFDCHRQFLCANHPYRRNRTGFYKNRVEDASPPPRLSGDQLWEEVANFPKSTDPNVETEQLRSDNRGWYKQSIFWQLPYWRNLLIRHNLDVMHIEKNVFEQLIHTIMGHKGKTQDNLQARKDIQLNCRRPSLYPIDDGKGGFIIPKAPYVLDKQEKIALCKWVSTLKFPDGYASNLSRCVDKRLLQLYGLKSHDCHVFLERLLPVAVKELLPPNIWKAMTELSQFFRDLCASSLKVDDMVRLQHNIPEILCKLEKIISPSFFNVMEHLPIHLPYEAMVGGPVHYRWMYRNERKMFNLKQKIGNKARVEGSICNAYLNEEISNFCCHYFEEDVDTKARDLARNAVHIDVISSDLNLPEIFRVNLGRASS